MLPEALPVHPRDLAVALPNGSQLPGMETTVAAWTADGWQDPTGSPVRICWPTATAAVSHGYRNVYDLRAAAVDLRLGEYPETAILDDATGVGVALDSCRIGHRQRMGRP